MAAGVAKRPAAHAKGTILKRPSASASAARVANYRKNKVDKKKSKAAKDVKWRARKAAAQRKQYSPHDPKMKAVAKEAKKAWLMASDAKIAANAAQALALHNRASIHGLTTRVDKCELRLDSDDRVRGYTTPENQSASSDFMSPQDDGSGCALERCHVGSG
jgi:hypothetical protein